jgi:hypothetical protein
MGYDKGERLKMSRKGNSDQSCEASLNSSRLGIASGQS